MADLSRRDRWSVIFLIMAVVIAVAAFFIGLSLENKVNSLIDERAELTEANAQLRETSESIKAANAELLESNQKLTDEREVLRGQVESGRYEISIAAKSQADLTRALMGEREFREWIRADECDDFFVDEPHCVFDREYAELLNLRQIALIKRSVASTSEDFADLRDTYRAIYDKNDEMIESGLWEGGRRNYSETYRAFAQEGQAYARYRLGDIDGAEKLILEAIPQSRASATANLTFFKIMCSKQVDAEFIRSAFDIARRNLDRNLERASDLVSQKVARVNRAHLEQDPEMLRQCAYAGISSV